MYVKSSVINPITFLENARQLGIRTNLIYVRKILQFFGNPQDSIQTIHVTGSNGKGSVCALIESIIRSCGYTTGMYTSPHLVHVHERIKYNGGEIPDTDLHNLLRDIYHACSKNKIRLTYFEILTCAAFLYFRQTKTDCACIETGMGGRWDATNTISKPLVSILTSLAKEHQAYLGSSIMSIAQEKAAIIKRNTPFVSGPCQTKTIEQFLITHCRKNNAPIWIYGKHFASRGISCNKSSLSQVFQYKNIEGNSRRYSINLIGPHQRVNAGIALATADILKKYYGFIIRKFDISRGLHNVRWPGRYEKVMWKHNSHAVSLYIDGAHNPAAMQALAVTIKQLRMSRVILFFGVLKDKDYRSMARTIIPLVREIWTLPVQHERGLSPHVLAQTIRDEGFARVKSVLSWDELFENIKSIRGHAFIMTGSLYLIGDFLKHLKRERLGTESD